MQEQQVKSAGSTDVQPTDIIFECPKCGKSLAIDPRGAGLVVACPDCKTEVQVPPSDGEETQLMSEEDTGGSEAPVDLAEQVRILEELRALDQQRIQQISAELGLIQAAIDRVAALIADAQGAE